MYMANQKVCMMNDDGLEKLFLTESMLALHPTSISASHSTLCIKLCSISLFYIIFINIFPSFIFCVESKTVCKYVSCVGELV